MSFDWSASRFAKPEESLGFLMWQATHAWQRQVSAALADIDVTHTQFVLLAGAAWLEAESGPPSQARLAAFTASEPMLVSQVAKQLEAKGLIERTPHPDDSRAKALALTRAGRKKLAAALPVVEDADAAYFGAVDRAALGRELAKLYGG